MPWVKLSDDWYDDEDLIEAGPLAMLLWPLLISWSLRNLQDGRIPRGQVRRLVDWSELGAEPEQAIAPLVACGRLQAVETGYVITNFLKYQPSREKVLSDREKDKQRKAAGRAKPPDDVRDVSGRIPDAPDPVPVPPVSSPLPSSSDLGRIPDDLWTTMADKKVATARINSNANGYRRKCIENDRKDAELVARALDIVERFDVSTSYLADCLISGTYPQNTYLRKRDDAA